MAKPKITILYYSTYGTNHAVAREAAAAMEAAGAEVRLRRARETAPAEVVAGQPAWAAAAEAQAGVPEVSEADMEWADGYWLSSPTRYGVPASQIRAFIDTLGPLWARGGTAGKTFTATSSAQNLHGGVEMTLLSLNTTAAHWGCILVPPGYTDPSISEAGGSPYGAVVHSGQFTEAKKAAVRHQAKRLVEVTARLIA